jgi:adenylate cyclase
MLSIISDGFMKRCPKCLRGYVDETQNFCLDDGAWLDVGDVTPESSTVFMPSGGGYLPLGAAESRAGTIAMPASQATSIAVLPFAHLSSDPDDEYFCDGLAEELINELAQIDELKVVARTSAFSFKQKNVDIAHIGRVLNVKTILEGSVRKSGTRLRITAQLINVEDGYHLWSKKYDREMSDIFDVQDEITRSIVGALRIRLLGDSADGLDGLADNPKGDAAEVEAYQLYLRGRFLFNKFTAESSLKAIELFKEATALDPALAAAHAGLAFAHVMTTEMGPVLAHVAMPKAKAAALKALSLDENLAAAHTALGMVMNHYDFDFAAAEIQYKRAIELSPNNSVARQSYALLLAQLERHDEAAVQLRRALDVDPLSTSLNWVCSFCLLLSREYDESLSRVKTTLELDPAFAVAYLSAAFVYQIRGDYENSVDAYVKCSEVMGIPENTAFLRQSFTHGWDGFVRAMIGPARPTTFADYIVAVFAAGAGELDQAFEHLESSLANRESQIVMLKADPRMDGIRHDPRYGDMLERIGFPAETSPVMPFR